jgi:hypothetical protein
MSTRKSFFKFLLAGILGLAFINTASAANVALGKTVAVNNGTFFSGDVVNAGLLPAYIVDYNTLTDGMSFENAHTWNAGTVWWQESIDSVQNAITVFLGDKSCKVSSLTLQVDNNDDYKVSWIDSKTGLASSVAVQPVESDGMVKVTVPVKANTRVFTITHDENGRGDDAYAVSEFSATGVCK